MKDLEVARLFCNIQIDWMSHRHPVFFDIAGTYQPLRGNRGPLYNIRQYVVLFVSGVIGKLFYVIVLKECLIERYRKLHIRHGVSQMKKC